MYCKYISGKRIGSKELVLMLTQAITRLCLSAVLLLAPPSRQANLVSSYHQNDGDDFCRETENQKCNPIKTHENIIDRSILEALEISPAAVAGEEIDERVYEMKLPPSTRSTLLDYCNDVGITKRFQQLLREPLEVNTNTIESFSQETGQWFMQRPDWFSDGHDNLHWLSPLNHQAHDDYLQVLGDANFDDLLESIGKYFELDSLVVYSVSFHAVSQVGEAEQANIQLDLANTNEAAWNIFIPLLLTNKTGPELVIVDGEREKELKYQLQENVALLMGEDVNYYLAKFATDDEMILVTIISVADVSIYNAETIVNTYIDQPFPPKDDVQWLYDHAGEHWTSNMNEISLPKHSETIVERLERTSKYDEYRMPRRQHLSEDDQDFDRDYADRFVRGAIDALHDEDCMSGEFDVSSAAFNADSAARVLQKCKVLVLRNVLDKTFLNEYRDDVADFIMAIHNGTVAATGTTTNNENYFLNQIAHKRWEVVLPKTFAHEDLIMDQDVMNILLKRNILGHRMVLHSLGAALAEPGAEAQTWHNDDDYLFSDLFGISGIGGHDLPSYAVTMMLPLLNMTSEHGPTEFCIGSSYLFPLDGNSDFIPLKDESLRPVLKSFMLGSRINLCPWKRRIPQLRFGDVLLFDYQILHRGGANNSPDLRSIMYMTFAREWYKDKNFRKPIDYYNYISEWDALYYQLTRSARFAIPDDDEEHDESRRVKPLDSLESIEQFLPPRY
jgi:ectoine hydroxylase-related dioxygenase (phytanoyl-CoA dioxygenase family)